MSRANMFVVQCRNCGGAAKSRQDTNIADEPMTVFLLKDNQDCCGSFEPELQYYGTCNPASKPQPATEDDDHE